MYKKWGSDLIYTINQTNIDTILTQLQVDPDVRVDIVNAVNAGKVVTVSKTNITYNGWTGCGYIIIDPTTGNGAYMISGGMNGGILTLMSVINWLLSLFISDAEAEEPYKDILADFPDTQCLYEGIYKCGKDAVTDALWNLYFPAFELACLVFTRRVLLCAAIGALITVISIGLSWDELRKCLDVYKKQCIEQPNQ